MNHPDEADVLSRARAGLSPAAADEDRVRRAVAAALAVGPSLPPSRAPRARRGDLRAWAARVALAGAVAAGAGALGYRAGFHAGLEQAPRPTTSPALPSRATPVMAAPGPRPPVEAPRLSPPAPRPPRAAPPATAPASAAASLDAEVRALRGAERALRDHEPGLALALLRELDRAVPDGKLIEEREATAAIARCALGDAPFGVDLAGDFAQRHPRSVYLQRVEQACKE